MEEAFEIEKCQMKEQLLEMEGLVMALELEMDSNPHRFVVLQLVDDRRNRTKRLTIAALIQSSILPYGCQELTAHYFCVCPRMFD